MDWPANVTRTYQNHHLDSTRWQRFEPRAGDVIVTTSYKAGTTWTLGVLYRMLALKQGAAIPPMDYWLDARFLPVALEDQLAELAAMPHQRVLKSHLAADGLPVWPEVRYVAVARDGRDVFMSALNHYSQFTDAAYEAFASGDPPGGPLPRFDGDVHALWREWTTSGWFDWETEGWPFWGNLHHVASWWALRHEPNVMLLHFNDLKADLPEQARRLAAFVGLTLTEDELEQVVSGSSLEAMRQHAIDAGDPLSLIFRDGARGFFYKGTNRRWRDVLSEEELELYHQAVARNLSPECAAWLENGGPIP